MLGVNHSWKQLELPFNNKRYKILVKKLEKAKSINSEGIIMSFTVNTCLDERVCMERKNLKDLPKMYLTQ